MLDPKLKAKWYAKLAKSGFEDIEDDQGRFKTNNFIQRDFKNHNIRNWEEKQAYYSRCSDFLATHKFRNPRERAIFALHVEGVPTRHIFGKVKNVRGVANRPLKHAYITYVLVKLKQIMLGRHEKV